MKPFLSWYTQHAPKTWSPVVLFRLETLDEIAQYPKTGEHGSIRNEPGIMAHAVVESALGEMPAACLAGMEEYVAEEEFLRGFPGSVPAPLGFLDDGTPWLNNQGDPVPVTQWDAQHFDVDRLLVIAHVHPKKSVRKRAWLQAFYLMQSLEAAMADPKKLKAQCLSGNQRAPAWVMSAEIRWARAQIGLGVMPLQTLSRLRDLLWGLWQLRQEQLAKFGPATPFIVLNDPVGLGQTDHGGCRATAWMTFLLLRALCELRELQKDLGADKDHHLEELIAAGLDSATYAFELGELHSGQPGRLVDDWDPVTEPHLLLKPTMPGWSLAGFAAADRQGLLSADLRARSVQLRDGTGYLDDRDTNHGKDGKLLGLSILVGGWLGWKSAAAA